MGIEGLYLSYISLIELTISHLVTTNNFLSFRCGNDQHSIQYRDENDLLLTAPTYSYILRNAKNIQSMLWLQNYSFGNMPFANMSFATLPM